MGTNQTTTQPQCTKRESPALYNPCSPLDPCKRHKCGLRGPDCYCLSSGEDPSDQLAFHIWEVRDKMQARGEGDLVSG